MLIIKSNEMAEGALLCRGNGESRSAENTKDGVGNGEAEEDTESRCRPALCFEDCESLLAAAKLLLSLGPDFNL